MITGIDRAIGDGCLICFILYERRSGNTYAITAYKTREEAVVAAKKIIEESGAAWVTIQRQKLSGTE